MFTSLHTDMLGLGFTIDIYIIYRGAAACLTPAKKGGGISQWCVNPWRLRGQIRLEGSAHSRYYISIYMFCWTYPFCFVLHRFHAVNNRVDCGKSMPKGQWFPTCIIVRRRKQFPLGNCFRMQRLLHAWRITIKYLVTYINYIYCLH